MFRGHTESVRTVAFGPGGTILAHGQLGRHAKIWNVETARISPRSGPWRQSARVAFGPGQTAKIEDDGTAWAPIAMG